MKRKALFLVAALFHEVKGESMEESQVLVQPQYILAVGEDLAKLKLTQMFPTTEVGAKALENLDQVQLIVKRV